MERSNQNGTIDIQDYERVITELKEDLTRYAQAHMDLILLEKADRLVLPGLGLKAELQALLEELIEKIDTSTYRLHFLKVSIIVYLPLTNEVFKSSHIPPGPPAALAN